MKTSDIIKTKTILGKDGQARKLIIVKKSVDFDFDHCQRGTTTMICNALKEGFGFAKNVVVIAMDDKSKELGNFVHTSYCSENLVETFFEKRF